MKNYRRLIDGCIILILILFVIIVTVIFLNHDQLPLSIYILFAVNTMLIVMGYWLGLVRGLILGMIVVFCYGTYYIYASIITGHAAELDYQQIMWLILFPSSAYIAGKLSTAVKDVLEQSQKYVTEMEELVLLDKETGFSNAKKFYIDLSEEISKAKRFEIPLTIMLIKIQYFDEFKSIYGERTSNKIIKNISRGIEECTRDIDKKARIEKDKFALILSNTDIQGSQVVKDRLKDYLGNLDADVGRDKKRFNIDYKIGAVQLGESDENSIAFKERAEEELEYDVG